MMIQKKHLTPAKWVRPGTKREKTRYIDIHDPGGTAGADGLFGYLENNPGRYGSYNYVVGHNGEIYEMIPSDEVSYSNGHIDHLTTMMKERFPELSNGGLQNLESVSVCLCRLDSFGNMSDATWEAGVWLIRLLMDMYELKDTLDVIPHYNITTQKVDPLLFWNNRAELDRFRWEIRELGKANG